MVPMPSQSQIEANHRNSQKSTGPRSNEGKAKTRFNALKFGINAKSQVIPGEDPAELAAIVQQYCRQFEPSSRMKVVLVNALIAADWQLQRLRKAEAQLWEWELAQGGNMGEAYSRNPALARLQREIRATQRDYERTFKQVEQMQKAEDELEGRERERMRNTSLRMDLEEILLQAKRRKPAEPAHEDALSADGVDGEAASNVDGEGVSGAQSSDPAKKGGV